MNVSGRHPPLPLCSQISSASSQLCTVSRSGLSDGKVLLAPAAPMGSGRRCVPPQHRSARHQNIAHETFTSLCGRGRITSASSLAEAGWAQSRRAGSIGAVIGRERVIAVVGGNPIDPSTPSSAHTRQGKGRKCRASGDSRMESEARDGKWCDE